MNYQDWFTFPANRSFGVGIALLLVIVLWELIWKGLGLWKAARANHSGWFTAILLLNTFGILPILYIYVFGVKDQQPKP